MTSFREAPRAPQPAGTAALIFAAQRVGLGLASRIAPGIARRWVTHLFCTPPRHPHPPLEKEWIARSRSLTVDGPNGRIAAWRWAPDATVAAEAVAAEAVAAGTVAPRRVLLMHGWGGRGTQLHAFIQPLLDAGYEVVALDGPAHGFSDSRYASMLHFARAIRAVVDHVGGVHGVIAHSLGGAATSLALAQGWVRAERVVTIAAPVDFDGYSRYFARQFNVSDAVRDAMQKHLERRLGFAWAELEGGRLAAQNATPALVVHDRGDKEVPFAAGERIAACWPGALLLPTERLGHRRILRDPAVVARAVEFMNAHRRALDRSPAAA